MPRTRTHGNGDRPAQAPSSRLSPSPRADAGAEPTSPLATSAPATRKRSAKVSSLVTQLQGAAAVSRSRTPSPGEDSADDDAEFEANTAQAIANAAARVDDTYANAVVEGPSDDQAHQFAKLLLAGVPQPDALCYVLGSVEPGLIELALPRWIRARNVVDALATLNGGRWPSLDADARMDIALDKHYAELAHYLYTHDYDSAEGKTLTKLDKAREALEAQRTGRVQANSPFMRFLNALLKPGSAPALGAGAAPKALGVGERGSTLGLADVEPVVEGEVTETNEQA